VSWHGISINVAPDLGHYAGIVPCGVRDGGVTSLADLGLAVTLDAVDLELRRTFERRFGRTVEGEAVGASAGAAMPAMGAP
jgi:lipoyl(octanoyl) transferase